MKALLLCYLLILFSSVKSNLPSYCFQPITQVSQGQPTTEPIQGRPGKIGPVGPPGPVGLSGSPGTPGGCACNPSEIEELRTEMQEMRETLNNVDEWVNNVRRQHYYSWCGVGIKDGRIHDNAMTASSHHPGEFQAYYGRLDNTGDPRGYWHPAPSRYNGAWLQVDLGSPIRVIGVVTQGRTANYPDWVTSYKILYGNTTSNLISIQSQDSGSDMIFQGNRDMNSKVTNHFLQPITARYFRLVLLTYHRGPVVRIEYLTC